MATQSTNGNSTQSQGSGPKVAIIGAGLTGLIAAHGLRQKGFEVAIFERDASIDSRPRDWSILIHWGMTTLKEMLPEHVLKNFPNSFCNPHLEFNEWDESVPGYSGLTGEVIFRNPTPGARRISRLRFRKILADGIDIQWGKHLEQMTAGSNSVDLVFRDGERFNADYVLGTDGASSKVRELLMGVEAAKPVPSGYSIANCVCKYGDADKVKAIVDTHSVCALMVGSKNMAGCGVWSVDDPSDYSTWETFWVKLWCGHSVSLQGEEAIKYATKDLAGICEPFRSALEWTPKDSPCYLDEMKYWLPSPWDTYDGRVTLAGDAAHPMLPFRGQGLQHAIIDVDKYITALTQLRAAGNTINRNETITAYGADVVERGSTAVAQALKEAEKALDMNTVGNMLMVTQGHGRSV
ncbi:FAD-dependent monooxygenase cctM [Colletotrichum spaethianum]|uniref:FAD-dependent monooxygenase cctM n=1 Tax=Colletotrichum spaethianum TaxID=700344 RepID=A0AA37PDE8_9PEZI|nr:FAD-dependent monooxygenase cctM [Colletotrichum spaethianum]GKT50080.1 FAD-dependent monooxygenase cctM [Colletotrichum spaethianum]